MFGSSSDNTSDYITRLRIISLSEESQNLAKNMETSVSKKRDSKD